MSRGNQRRGCRGQLSSEERNGERLESRLPPGVSWEDLVVDSAMADNHPELEDKIGGELSVDEAWEYLS